VINVGPFRTLALQYEEISSKLDFIVSRLQLLQSKISPDEAVLERPQGMPAFSLKTEEAFNQMEQFLSKDENFRLTVSCSPQTFFSECFFKLQCLTLLNSISDVVLPSPNRWAR
jgi:hypothetical protein